MMKLTHDRQKAWVTDEGMVIVSFDEDGRYDGGSFIGPGVRTPAPLDRLRLWLRW